MEKLFNLPKFMLSDMVSEAPKQEETTEKPVETEKTPPPAEIESKYLPVTAVVLGPMTLHLMPNGVTVAILFSEQVANEILSDFQSTPDFATEFGTLVEIVGREVRIPTAIYDDFKGYFVAKGWLNESTNHTPLNYPLLERTIVDSKQEEIITELKEEEDIEDTTSGEEEVELNI